MDKLSIKNEMSQVDHKNYAFYDELTDEEKKKFSTYLMLRYTASVSGNVDLQSYYLLATNKYINKYFFDLNKHPKLQWLTCCTVSPDMGNQFHYWLAAKKKESTNKGLKFLQNLYPNQKLQELELLAKLNDTADLKNLARKHGWSDERIKKEL